MNDMAKLEREVLVVASSLSVLADVVQAIRAQQQVSHSRLVTAVAELSVAVGRHRQPRIRGLRRAAMHNDISLL